MTAINDLGELAGQSHANVFPGAEPMTVRLARDAGEAVGHRTVDLRRNDPSAGARSARVGP